MSFKLKFYCTSEKPRPDKARIIDYFKGVSELKVKPSESGGKEFVYFNEYTGVYFTLHYAAEINAKDTADIPTGFNDTGITFDLNYSRPSFFALEAMPIIEAFQSEFHFYAINQSPADINPENPERYTADELVSLWEKGNEQAVAAERSNGTVNYIPQEISMNIWQYAKNIENMQKNLGNRYYVPKIYIIKDKGTGELYRAVSWAEAIPQIVPECDYVIVRRIKPGVIGLSKKPQEGIVRYDYLMSKVSKFMAPFNGPVPGMKILHKENHLFVKTKFIHMRISELSKFEGVPMDGFVDVPPCL